MSGERFDHWRMMTSRRRVVNKKALPDDVTLATRRQGLPIALKSDRVTISGIARRQAFAPNPRPANPVSETLQ